MSKKTGPAGRIAAYFMNSKLTPLAILASLLFASHFSSVVVKPVCSANGAMFGKV